MLTGNLSVTIHKMQGLDKSCGKSNIHQQSTISFMILGTDISSNLNTDIWYSGIN